MKNDWGERPLDYRNLINPAFCGVILTKAAKEYGDLAGHGMPLSLMFLLLPLSMPAYLPILEDKTRRVTPTFDQLLDQLMENKKGVAEGALQRDEFLQPRESEDEAGLQVFSGLEASANARVGTGTAPSDKGTT